MSIQVLDPHLANQIAAGEVVERPASVVKELIENSLDAHAHYIIVDIEQGGHQSIRVRDDGVGIAQQDLLLALHRHATSKIASLVDLEHVQSLGFRGEALASIQAVSQLKLTSHHQDSDSAWCVQGELSQLTIIPAAHPIGTTVEVKNLFYNTPARRKFLRQPKTEFQYIQMNVERLALSRFDVGFVLNHQQRLVWETTPALDVLAQERRLATLLGETFLSAAIPIEVSAAHLKLRGWLALPHHSRNQTDMQYWYVNGRFVRDKLLSHALKQAYHPVLFQGRQPIYVLYLECDPAMVDVNVHPTKHEVRFHESRLVYNFILRSVRDALAAVKPVSRELPSIVPPDREFHAMHQQALLLSAVQEASPPEWAISAPPLSPPPPLSPGEQQPLALAEPQQTVGKIELPVSDFPLGFAIAQLHHIYILAQNTVGLIIVDMHAAHERILYEKMQADLLQQGRLAAQVLLLPVSITVTPAELQCFESHQDFFHQMSLEVQQVGPNTLAVRTVPILLKELSIDKLFHDILADLLTQEASFCVDNHLHTLLGNVACHAAIQAQHRLSIPQMNAILRAMEQTSHSSYCNHGRPTWIQFSLAELDRFFLRGR